MVHNVFIVHGMRKYQDEFVTWLLNRQHMCQMPNQPGILLQPNVREVRIYDISTAETCEGQLLYDLAPFTSIEKITEASFLKTALYKVGVFLMKKMGLEKPAVKEISKREATMPRWREHIRVYSVGRKKDTWLNGVEMI